MANVGDVFIAEAGDLNTDGFGVARLDDGMVVFVAGLWPGERGRCRLVSVHKTYGVAFCEHREVDAPARIRAFCPHHGHDETSCTGCIWQDIDYPAQIAAKQARTLQQTAHLNCPPRDMWSAPDLTGYRNRAQFKTDGRALGYVNRVTRDLVAISQCEILTKKNKKTLRRLLELLPQPRWQGPKLTSLDIDEGVSAETVSVDARRPFLQGNDKQNKKMGRWLAEQIAELRRPRVVELFAGNGNLTVHIAPHAAEITAFDATGEAIQSLRERKLPNVISHIADLSNAEGLARQLKQIRSAPTCLVLDPPRAGFPLLAPCLALLPQLTTVIYISCDLESFARDSVTLQEAGFVAKHIQPLDLFPHTPHVELLTKFQRP